MRIGLACDDGPLAADLLGLLAAAGLAAGRLAHRRRRRRS